MVVACQMQHAMHHQMGGMVGECLSRRLGFGFCHAMRNGDVAGIEGARRSLTDWLDWMGLIDAGNKARLDRYIGYYEPYATSHESLDRDTEVQEETRNVARALILSSY